MPHSCPTRRSSDLNARTSQRDRRLSGSDAGAGRRGAQPASLRCGGGGHRGANIQGRPAQRTDMPGESQRNERSRMRINSWIVALIVGLAIVLFAVSNRAPVAIGFWPLDGNITVPVFLAVLIFGFAAFLVGGVVTLLSLAHPCRVSRR